MASKKNKQFTEKAGGRYLCQQCFSLRYRNDVLFTKQSWVTSLCDIRQAVHRAAFDPDRFDAWCRAGKSRVVMTWHGRPLDSLRVCNGVVQAMQDAGGEWLDQKVCPICHSLLMEEFPIVFGWSSQGLDSAPVREMFRQACEGDESTWSLLDEETTEAVRYEYIQKKDGSLRMGVPAGLDQGDTNHAQLCRDNCCLNVEGVIVRLVLKPAPDGEIDDLEAEQTLNALLQRCQYSGTAMKKCAVFVISAPDMEEEPAQYLERRAEQLFRSIQYSFARVRFAASGQTPQQASEILSWLAQNIQDMN